MRRVAISVGHTGSKESGAEHPELGVNELRSSMRVRNVLKALLGEYRDIEVLYAPDEPGYDLSARIQWIKSQNHEGTIDVAVEVHFNAYTDRNVDGCECLYYPTDATAQAWAEKMQVELVSELAARNRGAKAFNNEKRNGFVRELAKMNIPAVIVEPLFITNDDRARQLISGDAVQRIAYALFRALTS